VPGTVRLGHRSVPTVATLMPAVPPRRGQRHLGRLGHPLTRRGRDAAAGGPFPQQPAGAGRSPTGGAHCVPVPLQSSCRRGGTGGHQGGNGRHGPGGPEPSRCRHGHLERLPGDPSELDRRGIVRQVFAELGTRSTGATDCHRLQLRAADAQMKYLLDAGHARGGYQRPQRTERLAESAPRAGRSSRRSRPSISATKPRSKRPASAGAARLSPAQISRLTDPRTSLRSHGASRPGVW